MTEMDSNLFCHDHPSTPKASSVSRVMKHLRAHAKDPGHHETPLSAHVYIFLQRIWSTYMAMAMEDLWYP